jgi:hypothetical protein
VGEDRPVLPRLGPGHALTECPLAVGVGESRTSPPSPPSGPRAGRGRWRRPSPMPEKMPPGPPPIAVRPHVTVRRFGCIRRTSEPHAACVAPGKGGAAARRPRRLLLHTVPRMRSVTSAARGCRHRRALRRGVVGGDRLAAGSQPAGHRAAATGTSDSRALWTHRRMANGEPPARYYSDRLRLMLPPPLAESYTLYTHLRPAECRDRLKENTISWTDPRTWFASDWDRPLQGIASERGFRVRKHSRWYRNAGAPEVAGEFVAIPTGTRVILQVLANRRRPSQRRPIAVADADRRRPDSQRAPPLPGARRRPAAAPPTGGVRTHPRHP